METLACNLAFEHVINCKECLDLVMKIQRSIAGSTITAAKSEAARLNGAKGGRPKKSASEASG